MFRQTIILPTVGLFGPHISVDALMEISHRIEVRELAGK